MIIHAEDHSEEQKRVRVNREEGRERSNEGRASEPQGERAPADYAEDHAELAGAMMMRASEASEPIRRATR